MKRIIIIAILVSVIFLISCTNLENYVPIEKYDEVHVAYVEAKQDRTELENENKSLQSDIDNLENEVEKYQKLLENLNSLLQNVYYVYQEKSDGSSVWGTGFSLQYGNRIFLVTAGHAVRGEYGLFENLEFRANFSDEWLFPELLVYENDFYNNRDYAIFYSDKITSGLYFDLNNSYPKYILGNGDNNIFKGFDAYNLIEGESGSPLIDIDGEVIGIVTGNIVDIDLVLEAIDNMK